MTPDIERLTQMARADTNKKFHGLMGMLLRREGLLASFTDLAGNKACGVDGMRKDDYRQGLDGRVTDLSERLRRLGYRPQPSRRVFIPKANGGVRALGIPSFEDRIVQDRMHRILSAIWEPEFCDFSYGFRPGRNAHQALSRVAEIITMERTQFVVEADIKGFFDHVSHDWMMKFLGHRITDPSILRIIHRFLKAGIMEDGAVHASEEGTPQGGLVSPTLANVYLHYVLDLWFEKRFARQCRGKAFLVRYADDYVACFTHEEDAKSYLTAMSERLAEFDLETEPSKTSLIRFGSEAGPRPKPGSDAPGAQSFSFLGFTHYVSRSRRGKFLVGRKTETKRVRKKLKEVNQKLKQLRTTGGKAMQDFARRHCQGHLQYYAVSGNSAAVRNYVRQVGKLLFIWLNRRSQRRSITWDDYNRILAMGKLLPRVKIVHDLYDFYRKPRPSWKTQTGSRMV